MIFLVDAISKLATATVNCAGSPCDTGLPSIGANGSNLAIIFQLVFGIIGAIAVLVIVIAGLRFILANGDPNSIAQARNTIIYAAVGLVIAISAELIITFVLTNV